MIFKRMYTAISTKLTDFEIHRTDAEWNSSFTLKYVLFCVVLYNTEPIYYVYFKEYHDDGNWPMVELNLLLMVFMVGEPLVTMVADGVMSLFKLYRKRRVRKTSMPDEEVPSWENDYMLEPVPAHVLTEYYADMVIQYGVVTMYSAVFPLAAICAVFRNVYNLRYITYQLSREWRRPVPERAPKFDDWMKILKAVSLVAIVMNAHIIVRKTQFVPRFMYNVVGGYGVGESYIDFSHPEVNVSRWLLRHTEVKEAPPANITACRVPVDEYYRLYVKDVSAGSDYYIFMRVFYDSFIFAMFIVAMLIAYAVPDIPTEENNWLKKQNRLAQSALSQYLARGKSQRESNS